MKRAVFVTLVVASLALAAPAAFAGNVHYKHGSPQFTDHGLTLIDTGSLAGLGNGDLVLTLTATGNPTALCTNQGGNAAAGQNPAAVTTTGTQAIPAGAIKNGNVSYRVETDPPAQPTAKEAGCPNNNWSATITDVAFTSATFTVTQNGATVLTSSCTFDPATSDGGVTGFTCS